VRIDALGHVALVVRDLRRAEDFYGRVLGMTASGRMGDDMTFFRVADDRFQDLALTYSARGGPGDRGDGLDHVAFRIQGSLEELRAAQAQLQALGIVTQGPFDHGWSASVYFADPDGNRIELYVDRSEAWRTDPNFTPTSALIDERVPTGTDDTEPAALRSPGSRQRR
jgi:catechol-2,3-dioxygenase